MQKQLVYKIYTISFLATITLLFLFIFLNNHFDGSNWQAMQQSKSALTAEYCELDNSTNLFRQRANTFSNLGYFFLGIIIILISFYDRKDKSLNKNLLQQFPAISFLFGSCLIYLCFGSSFFHASLTWLGQRADMNATYSICIVLIGISAYKLFIKQNTSTNFKRIFVAVLLLIIVAFAELHLLISSTILLPTLLLSIIILTSLNYFKNKEGFNLQPAILSFVLIIAAFIIRTLDVKKIACNPMSVYQGHAVWHLFTGMSAFLLYWFYRSERVKV